VRKAVFLDRDGVINHGGQINRPHEVHLIPGAAEAIERLKAAGYSVVVVTNQGGLGESFDGRVLWRRPPLSRDDLEAIHEELLRQLGPAAQPDLIKFCPHATYLNCPCRKPKPGMLKSAAKELDLEMASSYIVGDRSSDLEAGLAAGVRPILVLTGDGQKTLDEWSGPVTAVPSILEAADLILGDR